MARRLDNLAPRLSSLFAFGILFRDPSITDSKGRHEFLCLDASLSLTSFTYWHEIYRSRDLTMLAARISTRLLFRNRSLARPKPDQTDFRIYARCISSSPDIENGSSDSSISCRLRFTHLLKNKNGTVSLSGLCATSYTGSSSSKDRGGS